MFDIGIGFSELMLLAVIVIIVVGPEELPSLLRTIGRYVGQIKRVADDFRSQVDDAIKEPMGEIQESIEGVSENLDDDPFGEEDLLDFEEHNKKILDKEKAKGEKANGEQGARPAETATEKALREGGVKGLEVPVEEEGGPDKAASIETADETVSEPPVDAAEPEGRAGAGDVVLAKKSGT